MRSRSSRASTTSSSSCGRTPSTRRLAMLELSDASSPAGETREGLEATILGLKQAQHESQMLGRQFLMTGGKSTSRSPTRDERHRQFFQKVAAGSERRHAFWQSLVQGIADFLRQIALAILKQTIFNALNQRRSRAAAAARAAAIAGRSPVCSTAAASRQPDRVPLGQRRRVRRSDALPHGRLGRTPARRGSRHPQAAARRC
jgi:hypothetical protein